MNANLTFIQTYGLLTSKFGTPVNVTSLQSILSSNITSLLTPDIQPSGSYVFALPSSISARGFFKMYFFWCLKY